MRLAEPSWCVRERHTPLTRLPNGVAVKSDSPGLADAISERAQTEVVDPRLVSESRRDSFPELAAFADNVKVAVAEHYLVECARAGRAVR